MKKVQAYQSIDGKLHETEEQCREHEQKVNLRQWYEGGNELMGNHAGSRVKFGDLVEWLVINQDKVRGIIEHYEI